MFDTCKYKNDEKTGLSVPKPKREITGRLQRGSKLDFATSETYTVDVRQNYANIYRGLEIGYECTAYSTSNNEM
jgi:hypothetical protein